MRSLKKITSTTLVAVVLAYSVAANGNEEVEDKGFWSAVCETTNLFCNVTTSSSNGGGKQPPQRPTND